MKRGKNKRQISWKRIAAIEVAGVSIILIAFSLAAALIVWLTYEQPQKKRVAPAS